MALTAATATLRCASIHWDQVAISIYGLPCFANVNMQRLQRAKETGRPEDCDGKNYQTPKRAQRRYRNAPPDTSEDYVEAMLGSAEAIRANAERIAALARDWEARSAVNECKSAKSLAET